MASNQSGYTLYGAEFSLYSGKVRSYLRKKGIPFKEQLATLSQYKRFIIPRTGVRYMPVLHTPDDQAIQDTSLIIDHLEAEFPANPIVPSKPQQRLVSALLEVFGDEWLLNAAMHYRWHYPQNHKFVFGEFGCLISPKLPLPVRVWLGRKIGAKFQGVLPALGITEATVAALEAWYEQLLASLEAHFSKHNFLLGDQPSMGDFGLIGPFYAHLYRDPHPGELMRRLAPAVAAWVERMVEDEPYGGSFLADDRVPETLLPLLREMAKEQVPVLLDTAQKVLQWTRENDPGEVPRRLGNHLVKINGVDVERVVLPFSLWKWQRPLAIYQSLSGPEKEHVAPLMQRCGLLQALEVGLPVTLWREKNVFHAKQKS